jgi:hypothetical protein
MSMMDDDDISHLDFDIEEPTGVTDLTTLNDVELSTLEGATREELFQLREMHAPPHLRSERGSELHSIFAAIQVEKHRRH